MNSLGLRLPACGYVFLKVPFVGPFLGFVPKGNHKKHKGTAPQFLCSLICVCVCVSSFKLNPCVKRQTGYKQWSGRGWMEALLDGTWCSLRVSRDALGILSIYKSRDSACFGCVQKQGDPPTNVHVCLLVAP